jgi:ornithine decarboxylase
MAPCYESVEAMLAGANPWEPMLCIWPEKIAAQARRFLSGFPGHVLYAVKANPLPSVIEALRDAGIGHFDVASDGEMAAVSACCPGAELYFHNPVKSRSAIRIAARSRQIRSFAVDHGDELVKCCAEITRRDLVIFVRVATRPSPAAQDFSTKFGANPDEAVSLLRDAHAAGFACGLTFHVGTQCRCPQAYADAIAACGHIARAAGVPLAGLDVGGGFPAEYDDEVNPPLESYFQVIARSFRDLRIERCQLYCEPGRALVAEAGAVVAQIVHRRGDRLHLNDGISGSFGELSYLQRQVRGRLYRRHGERVAAIGIDAARDCGFGAFTLVGPLAFDSADELPGRYSLPADAREGDWIALDRLGAYATCLAANFHTYHRPLDAVIAGQPRLDARECRDAA